MYKYHELYCVRKKNFKSNVKRAEHTERHHNEVHKIIWQCVYWNLAQRKSPNTINPLKCDDFYKHFCHFS
jgi:hypothetical protein